MADPWDRKLAKAADLSNAGRYLDAVGLLEEARAQAAQVNAADTRVALALNNLGTVHIRLNDFHKAEQCYRRSAEIWEAHGEVLNRIAPVTNLVAVYLGRRMFTAADKLLGRQMKLAREKLGPEHQQVSVLLTYMAQSAFLRGDFETAAREDERALELVRKLHPGAHPNVAVALDNLGTIYRAQHRLEASSRVYTEALEIMQASGHPQHPAWIRALAHYGVLCLDQGRYDEAKSLLQQALERAEQCLRPKDPAVASILKNYALVLRKTRHKKDADQAEARAAAILHDDERENPLRYTVDVRDISSLY
jgi:tetratricopeptide (TPR) repeat protein